MLISSQLWICYLPIDSKLIRNENWHFLYTFPISLIPTYFQVYKLLMSVTEPAYIRAELYIPVRNNNNIYKHPPWKQIFLDLGMSVCALYNEDMLHDRCCTKTYLLAKYYHLVVTIRKEDIINEHADPVHTCLILSIQTLFI